ncbi:hypothetical protein FNF29_08200 [Cafeteria roenbergensis]|uniref:AB hydrolase-1 domain-containing protein n=1 Tax=Cafeteria roenbergensis TaxID=33653 RepID=A0A5A8BZL6_CAFRO|nr:hypothetical protein FNF29_08200 [Cafeteria roenbergensis]|eukprot:KAA0146183.1 hypothetical protein FNF29_08200 [Cafeteria roenbergensis]
MAHSRLASEVVTAGSGKRALFLHGAMGRGSNWQAVARRFCRENKPWGARVADLRNHGESMGVAGPHTLAAAGQDVIALASALGREGERIDALVGHSLGGRVALEAVLHAADQGWESLAPDSANPLSLVLMDTSPGALPATADVHNVLDFIETLPSPIPGDWRGVKQRFLDAGFSEMLASWMTTNVKQAEGEEGLQLTFDTATIRSLLDEYALPEASTWHRLRELPPWVSLTLVVGNKGARWHSAEAKEELAKLATVRDGAGTVRVHRVPTGHWLHVEDPKATQRALQLALLGEQR